MKTGKTPFEIRLDLLELAHKIVTQRYEAELAKIDFTKEVENIEFPLAPTTSEVISEAEKLNRFVSTTER